MGVGTEPPGSGEYDKHFPKDGVYVCVGCETPLYDATAKVRTCGSTRTRSRSLSSPPTSQQPTDSLFASVIVCVCSLIVDLDGLRFTRRCPRRWLRSGTRQDLRFWVRGLRCRVRRVGRIRDIGSSTKGTRTPPTSATASTRSVSSTFQSPSKDSSCVVGLECAESRDLGFVGLDLFLQQPYHFFLVSSICI